MRVKGPMFSLEASGTVGGVITASKWKGRAYFRTTVTPSNPRSGAQTGTRAMFAFLGAGWADVDALEQATWEALGAQNAFSPFNAYQQANMRAWTQFEPPYQATPAEGNGTPADVTQGNVSAGVRQAVIGLTIANSAQNWGVALFRGDDDTLTPAPSNAVKIVQAEADGDLTLIDTPVPAGTYGYVARPFTDDGVWGNATPIGNVTIT